VYPALILTETSEAAGAAGAGESPARERPEKRADPARIVSLVDKVCFITVLQFYREKIYLAINRIM
tara:strand:+ start:37 stop:234 length:198 start_codon:yes stop_codon:yes gene_type:complete